MVKAATSAEVKGRVRPGGVDGLGITFEHPVPCPTSGSGIGIQRRSR